MTVRAVENYNRDRRAFPTVLASTAIGAGAGFAMKYAFPVIDSETEFRKKTVVLSSRKVANQNIVDKIKNSTKEGSKPMTLAQDTFVKVIENKKGNTEFLPDAIAKKVKELNKLLPNAGEEYRNLIHAANEAARKDSESIIRACRYMIKSDRSLAGFLIPGSVVGLMAGIFANVFRDNKQA